MELKEFCNEKVRKFILGVSEQIFKSVEGVTYAEWHTIAGAINTKYALLQNKVKFTGSNDGLVGVKKAFSSRWH